MQRGWIASCRTYMYFYVQFLSLYAVHVLVWLVYELFSCICISIVHDKHAGQVWIVSLQAYVSVFISKMYCNVTASCPYAVCVVLRDISVFVSRTCTCTARTRPVFVHLHRYCPSSWHSTCLDRVLRSICVCCYQ